ncbi:MAG TPA: DUF805 domain-containing protein [Candidatus Krumholzibacteria bacterium]|nr:DUF805 domain-containing protein [Candidatus Krumholzibacteria bacterium]
MGNLFSMRGRIGRGQYVIITTTIVLISYAFAFAIGFVSAVSDHDVHNAGVLGLIVAIAACALQGVLSVRRLHDLGRSGWHFWLLLIPFYNIYLSLVLCFERGSRSDNEYGPAPA